MVTDPTPENLLVCPIDREWVGDVEVLDIPAVRVVPDAIQRAIEMTGGRDEEGRTDVAFLGTD
ncbi:MAG: hypothetical protein R3313_05205 [Candidatus Saccharimonadales bacterium]|nr:hypothetical protein [Candidatus Saccharimonadales bacterium]